MSQNETRYHSAFVALAKGSEIRPLRSRRGLLWMLFSLLLLALASGVIAYHEMFRTRGPATHAPASLSSSEEFSDPVEESTGDDELSAATIDQLQRRLHDNPGGSP